VLKSRALGLLLDGWVSHIHSLSGFNTTPLTRNRSTAESVSTAWSNFNDWSIIAYIYTFNTFLWEDEVKGSCVGASWEDEREVMN
jgi:hypothetical protein